MIDMYGLGRAAGDLVNGLRLSKQDHIADQEREYQSEERQYNREQRDSQNARQQVLSQRQDTEWDQKQAELGRQQAIREGMSGFQKGKLTGDYSGLTKFFQDIDSIHGANVISVEPAGDGMLRFNMSDKQSAVKSEKDVIELMRYHLSPENWLNLLSEKEMLGLRTDAQKEVNQAQGEQTLNNQQILSAQGHGQNVALAGVNSQNRIAENQDAAFMKNPEVIETSNEDGTVRQDIYQAGNRIETRDNGLTPEMIKAQKSGSGTDKDPTELQVSNFFKSFADSKYGSSDKAGNFFIPTESKLNAANVAELGEMIYRGGKNLGVDINLNSAAAKALRYINDNPSLSMEDAKKRIRQEIEDGKRNDLTKPGRFYGRNIEDDKFEQAVAELMNSSRNPTASTQDNGLPDNKNPQTKYVATPQNTITDVPRDISVKMAVGNVYKTPYGYATKLQDGTIIKVE